MSRIRGKGTKPELIIRRGLHHLGFRYRLYDNRLPGKPDIVLPKYNAIILVHGCFWHWHDCQLYKLPASHVKFWEEKVRKNRKNDMLNLDKLGEKGWRILTVWECSLRGSLALSREDVLRKVGNWITSQSQTYELRGSAKSSKRYLLTVKNK